jgi:transglutaminase-like putative cysteine protease
MRIRAGFEITYECPQPSPMLLMLSVHPSRQGDLEMPDTLRTAPNVDVARYHDGFGNICHRMLAPPGHLVLSADFVVRDSGLADPFAPRAAETKVENLPEEAIVFLLGSRYCETDRLSEIAWSLFGGVAPGWARVQSIVDYVHDRITFGYQHARPTKTAWDAHEEQLGVCRDYAHLAIAFCRCMNIPARYCTGYLGDIGVPLVLPMDFSAWFDVFLDGQWYPFDARNNQPRIGRVLMARGRDAVDTAITTTFGPATLVGFDVVCEELGESAASS